MTAVKEAPQSCPTLRAETAAELMCSELVSVREDAFVPEAIALLTRKGFHAAPVIDDAGRPVGVLSFTDLLVHERNRKDTTASDSARVRDLMTPAVFSVPRTAPAPPPGTSAALAVARSVALTPFGLMSLPVML